MTHDYRNDLRRWGWDISYRPIENGALKAHGWGYGIKPGDYFLLSNGDNDTRYKVGNDFRYTENVMDMWFATLYFAPRQEENA